MESRARRSLQATLALLLVVLVGCASKIPVDPVRAAPTQSHAAHPQFLDCHTMLTHFTWPLDMGPGTVPSSWGPSDAFTSSVYMELFDCEHASIGPFERGPVQLLVEMHDKGLLPEGCILHGAGLILNIEKIIVSDPAISRYLQEEGFTPTLVGTFRSSTSSVAGEDRAIWTWQIDGNTSTLNGGSFTAVTSPVDDTERWIAINGSGLVAIDAHYTYTNTLQNAEIHGDLSPPMLYATAVPGGHYLGVGDIASDYKAEWTITKFKDQQCGESTA